jgi:hypothetical protein
MQRTVIRIVIFLMIGFSAQAQDNNLLNMLNDSMSVQKKREPVTGTFKATQLVNVPTIESPGRKSLQFLIQHRFGQINGGAYQLFGLDNAEIRFGLDYGITDRLSVGVGRSSFEKAFDGSLKYKLIMQKENGGAPVSVSLFGLVSNYTLKEPDKPWLNANYRTSYTTQLLIARKFTPALSLEFVPSYIHYNDVPTPQDKNDLFAFTMGGRLKFTKRMSIDAEYNYLLPNQVVSTKVYNALSLGLDIETGGHVFQLVFTNAQGMTGPYYLSKTPGTWGKGDIFFGFNISRSFNWKK